MHPVANDRFEPEADTVSLTEDRALCGIQKNRARDTANLTGTSLGCSANSLFTRPQHETHRKAHQ